MKMGYSTNKYVNDLWQYYGSPLITPKFIIIIHCPSGSVRLFLHTCIP